MLDIIGGVLGGLGQLAGGIGSLSRGGGGTDWTQIQLQREFFEKNQQLQREFAQNGIRWKVDDAKAAGLHPLAAIGAAGASYSPMAYVPGSPLPDRDNMGQSLKDMGQGLSRALQATASREDRQAKLYDEEMRKQQLTRAGLENELLVARINSERALSDRRAGMVGPPLPVGPGPGVVPGLGNYEAKPPEVLNQRPEQPGVEAGPSGPGNRFIQVPGGVHVGVPARDLQIDEITSPGGASWQFWNSVAPLFNRDLRKVQAPPDSTLPPGYHKWRWTPFGYYPAKFFDDFPARPPASEYQGYYYNRRYQR